MDVCYELEENWMQLWNHATQLEGKEGSWVANGRDEFLDAIMESNSNEMITFDVMGTKQHLKLWDSGGLPIPEKRPKSINRGYETNYRRTLCIVRSSRLEKITGQFFISQNQGEVG